MRVRYSPLGTYFSLVISRSPAGAVFVFSFHHMDQEGAASSAPDERPSDEAAATSDIVSGIATVEPMNNEIYITHFF